MTDPNPAAAEAPSKPAPIDEDVVIKARRTRANVPQDAPRIGLALSGGGIRSATFCLGLIRALARNGVLHRFDYLSTVSGGGYIGSMLGRLFHKDVKPEAVEEGLARDGSLVLWWLRNNGRFLAPAGAADLLQALAGQLRGFLATQVEVMVLMVLFASVITLPHLGWSLFAAFCTLPLHVSIWWYLLPIPAACGITMCYAYWFLGKESGVGAATAILATAVGIYLAIHACNSKGTFDAVLLGVGALALLPSPIAWLAARISGARGFPEDSNRVRYTTGLSNSLRLVALTFAFGALDMVSWYMRSLLEPGHSQANGRVAFGVGAATIVLVLARMIMPMLKTKEGGKISNLPWAMIANITGLVLVVGVAIFWLTIFQAIIFPEQDNGFAALLHDAWLRWLAVAVASAAYIVLNGRLLQQLNRSSLHFFYRSRLARAYVSVGNCPEGDSDLELDRAATDEPARFKVSPLKENTRQDTQDTTGVTRLVKGDDICMSAYHPHQYGGPVHLVNCCINQTVDDRTGNFNADRNGIYLTVSSLGVETGTHGPVPGSGGWLSRTTLAEWVAVSGAAIGSGMGSMTRPGVAALSFLTGLRLGYWQGNLLNGAPKGPTFLSKYRALLQEMFARFPGLRNNDWYLSDGGHFDNTGVYALLKRKLRLIVLADCGADPGYLFADVENLVRKARIDYDATIEFIDPASLVTLAGAQAGWFGTPDTIVPEDGPQHFLLARISYDKGPSGALLIVKPRRSPDMPLDVAGYAGREVDFPQQSTSNQFFSESEWESYCALGTILGAPITEAFLDQLPSWADRGTVMGTDMASMTAPVADRPRSKRIATTVGASLGIGAIATGAIAGWQAWGDHRDQQVQWQSNFNSESRLLREYLYEAAQKKAPFNEDADASLSMFASSIDGLTLSDKQTQVMQDLSQLLEPLCGATTDGAAHETCEGNMFFLASGGRESTPWDRYMVGYVAWHERTPGTWERALVEYVTRRYRSKVVSGTAAVNPTPSASVSPPPPVTATTSPPGVVPGSASSTAVVTAQAVKPPIVFATKAKAPAQVDPTTQAVLAACRPAGQPAFVMYTQIYDESQRDPVNQLLGLARTNGISATDIENVTATAAQKNRRAPYRWRSPTILYGPEGKDCAQKLAAWITTHPIPASPGAAQAVPLPSWAESAPNTLELWLPPPRS
ncbi:patatin-like phospholipase family protein [Pinirhizobacter soli]|uniref:patatin-like phospholipase family protein n=1 Tax=Pinirhizobacter soli TaxID=2786953 RepID=UPI00202A4AAE|nr:patatin-like phospholipase family protein [Pinirhizobacter soli]